MDSNLGVKSKLLSPEDVNLSLAMKRLAKHYGLDFIILFGSQAKKKAGSLSDIDIAVHVRERLTDKDLFNLQLSISAELCEIFHTDKVDVITLNNASLRLQYEVFKHGRQIYCENQEAYRKAYVRAVDNYLDFQPYLKRHYEAAKRYFEEV